MIRKIVLISFVILINWTQAQSFLWAKNVGSYPLTAATNTSGVIYTAGNFQGVVDFDPGIGTFTLGITANVNSNLFISSSDAAGNFLSALAIMPTPGQGYVTPHAIKTDVSGNIYITGNYLTASGTSIDFDPGSGTYTVSSSQPSCFILKLNSSGNLVWMSSLDGTNGSSVGTAISIDASGNVITSGYFKGTTDFDPGASSSYTISTLTNVFSSFVVKLNSSGNFVWAKDVSGTADVQITCMTLDILGNMFFAGQYQGTADFDPNASSTFSLISAGGNDIFELKLDGSGNFLWAKSMGGSGTNYATSLAVDANGNSHLTGASAGLADFDPGVGTYTLTSVGPTDIFILKLDASGNFSWVKTIGTSSAATWLKNAGMSIDLDVWGNVYTVGAFSGSLAIDFDPGPGNFPLTSAPSASWSSFISELDPSGSFIWAGTMDGGEAGSVVVFGSSVYVAGKFIGTADLDPTAGTYTLSGYSDGYILKLTSAPSINGPILFCNNNGSATATYSVPQEPGSTYAWTLSPGAILNSPANTTSINVTLSQGSTTLFVTVSNSIAVTSRSVIVNVGPTPVVSFSASPSLSVCSGSSITLNGVGATSYAWSGGISNSFPFMVNSSMNYTVTGYSAIGCTALNTVAVVAYSLPFIFCYAAPSSTICSGASLTLYQLNTGISTYTWSGGIINNVPFTTTASAAYSVSCTTSNGCINSATIFITVNPNPTITANGGAICSGKSFTINPMGGNTYTYSGGSNIVNPAFTSSYSVIGTNTNGCVSSSVAIIVVTVNALPTLTVSGPNAICVGNNASLSVTGASTFSWSTGSTSSIIAVSPTATSNYSVVGTDGNGCNNLSSKSITVNALPTLTVSGPNAICAGNNASLSVSGASTFSWSTGSTSSIIAVSPTVTSNYSVVGTDGNGCNNLSSKSITVNPLPVVLITTNTNTVCSGDTVILSAQGALSYTWTNAVISQSVIVIPVVNMNYTVIGTDLNGCVNYTSISIFANPLPTVSIVGTSVICNSETTILLSTGASNYTWSTGATTSSIMVSPTSNTTYSVLGAYMNGCSNNASFFLVSNPLPSVSIFGTNNICLGESLNLNAIGATSYTWNTGQNFASIVVSPTSNTTYSIVGANNNGCKNTSIITVSVSECTDVKSNPRSLEIFFQVFPNPNNGQFTINTNTDLHLNIINVLGQNFASINLDENNNRQTTITNLSPGIYYLVSIYKEKILKSKIIVN